MNYRFDISKATDAACWLTQKEGGKINIMKLVKLLYLLDRASVAKRGVPVVGGAYYSMRNGPITSEVLDLINAGKLADETDEREEATTGQLPQPVPRGPWSDASEPAGVPGARPGPLEGPWGPHR